MKKLLLLLLVSTSLRAVNKPEIVEPIKRSGISRKIGNGIQYSFKTADSFLNYVLTIKGAVKTLIFASPVIYAYFTYKGINTCEEIEKISHQVARYVARTKTSYEIESTIGEHQAILGMTTTRPGWALYFIVVKFLKKVMSDVKFSASPAK